MGMLLLLIAMMFGYGAFEKLWCILPQEDWDPKDVGWFVFYSFMFVILVYLGFGSLS